MVTSLGMIGGQTFNENVIRFGDVGRDGGTRTNSANDWGITGASGYPSAYGLDISGSFGIRNTIIHELGHVFYKRSSSMASRTVSYQLPAVYTSPEQGTYWENNTLALAEEYLADHFLNWVRDSYVDADPDVHNDSDPDDERRIAAFWIGDIEFIEDGTNLGESEGIQIFADEANAFANLDELTKLKDCIS